MRLTQALGMDRETIKYHRVRAYGLTRKAIQFKEKGNTRLASKFYEKAAREVKKAGGDYTQLLRLADWVAGKRPKPKMEKNSNLKLDEEIGWTPKF